MYLERDAENHAPRISVSVKKMKPYHLILLSIFACAPVLYCDELPLSDSKITNFCLRGTSSVGTNTVYRIFDNENLSQAYFLKIGDHIGEYKVIASRGSSNNLELMLQMSTNVIILKECNSSQSE